MTNETQQTAGKTAQRSKSEPITPSLAAWILARCFKDSKTGRTQIALRNCRLDFEKTYFFNGFTKKAVKLSYVNGFTEINVLGKLELRDGYYSLYTEGWQFIELIESSEVSAK